jgi:hypothetical protein
MIARMFIRSRSSIGSNPASPARRARLEVSVFHGFGHSCGPVAGMPSPPGRLAPPVGCVSGNPEMTLPSNFPQLRDTTLFLSACCLAAVVLYRLRGLSGVANR